MIVYSLDVLNVIQIGFLLALTVVAIRITFAAYIDGVRQRLDDLKRHCQFLGVSIIALTCGSMFVGADITARCYIKVETMEQKVQQLTAHKGSQIQVSSYVPLWTVITPSGNEITWRQEDGVRSRTSSGSESDGGRRHIGVSGGSGNRGSISKYGGLNAGQYGPNQL